MTAAIIGLLTLMGVAFANNFPVIQHIFLVLPLVAVFAVQKASTDTQRLLNIVVACLIYAGLSGSYEFAAAFGLLSCWMLVARTWGSLSATTVVVLAALLIQIWFMVGQQRLQLVIYGFSALQLLVIIGLAITLESKWRRRV